MSKSDIHSDIHSQTFKTLTGIFFSTLGSDKIKDCIEDYQIL